MSFTILPNFASLSNLNNASGVLSNRLYQTGSDLIALITTISGSSDLKYVNITGSQSISGEKRFYNSIGGVYIHSLDVTSDTLEDQYIDLNSSRLFDSTPAPSLNWTTRELINIAGDTTIDWDNKLLSGTWNTLGSLKISGNSVITGFDTSLLASATNLTTTGATLNNKINALSGYSDNFLVHRLGNESITGNKRFIDSGTFDGTLIVSGKIMFPNPSAQPLFQDSLTIRYLNNGGIYIGDVDVGAGIDTVTVGSRQDNDGTVSTAMGVANIVYSDYSVIVGNTNEAGNAMGGKFGYVFGNGNGISQFNTGFGAIGNYNEMLTADKINLLAIGERNHLFENNSAAIGFNLTNTTPNSMHIGVSDNTKIMIESGQFRLKTPLLTSGSISGLNVTGHNIIALNFLTVSGHPVLTGLSNTYYLSSNPNSYATSGNLQSTGQTLNNKINSLSGYLTGNFVDIDSQQSIVGNKTFQTAVTFENVIQGINGSAINFGDPLGNVTDDNNLITLSWTPRRLYNTSEIVTLDWQNKILSGNWKTNDLNVIGNLTVSGQPITGGSSSSVNIPNIITGSGTLNYVPRFINTSGIITGSIYDNGLGRIGLGTTTLSHTINLRGVTGSEGNLGINITNTDGANMFFGKRAGLNNRLLFQCQNQSIDFESIGVLALDVSSNGNTMRGGGTNPGLTLYTRDLNRNVLSITNTGVAIGSYTALMFAQQTDDFNYAQIRGYSENSSHRGALELLVSSGSKANWVTGLRLTNNGNIGINTTSPFSQAKLDVSGNIYAIGGKVLTSQDSGNLINYINSLSGISTGEYYRPTQNYNVLLDWRSGNVFQHTFTGNVSFGFTGERDGQTIVVSTRNTGILWHSGNWPAKVKWPNDIIPQQTSGSKTDIQTFICVGTGIYGNSVQNFTNY